MMLSVRVLFQQRTTKTAIAAAIYLQQDTEMLLRWNAWLNKNLLHFVWRATFSYLINLAKNVKTHVQFLVINLWLRAFPA